MSRNLCNICSALFFLLVCSSRASQGDIVCRQVENICSNDEAGDARLPGPPGKRGPKGERGVIGEPGPRGQPEEVDYDKINDTIKELFDAFAGKFAELQTLTNNLKEVACGVQYGDICFRVVWFETPRTYNIGKLGCKRIGFVPADIENETIYDVIVTYVKSVMFDDDSRIHLGSTFDIQKKRLILNDGRTTTWAKWRPDAPFYTSPQFTQMMLGVHRDPSVTNVGMWNYNPEQPRVGVLCMHGFT